MVVLLSETKTAISARIWNAVVHLTVKTSESWLTGTTVSFPFFYHTNASVLARIWIAIIHMRL